jgi:hypothetical protein
MEANTLLLHERARKCTPNLEEGKEREGSALQDGDPRFQVSMSPGMDPA